MNLIALTEFLKKSGMRKVGAGLYMFSILSYLVFEKALTGEEYKAVAIVIVLALMGANAYEHKTKEKPDAPAPTAPPSA